MYTNHSPHTVSKREHIFFAVLLSLLLVVGMILTGFMISSAPAALPTSTSTTVDYLNPGGTTSLTDFTLNANVGGTITPITSNVNDRNQFLKVGLNKVNQEFIKEVAPNQQIRDVKSVAGLIVVWINFFLGFYVLVAVLIFIYLGIRFLLSAGSDDKRKGIIKMFSALVLGTFLIMCSYAIIQLILYFVGIWSGSAP